MITAAIKPNCFQDSVSLMIISKKLSSMNCVEQVSVMMGTPANKELLKNTGLWHDIFNNATPNDICISINTKEHNDSILVEVEKALDQELTNLANYSKGKTLPTVRSWTRATKIFPQANIALISIAGEYAADTAHQALDKGLNVMLFSDNIPLEQERQLKLKAKENNLIVMGPDCGTSIIAGIPLAFANRVPEGCIGIVGASGTGIQELCSQIVLQGEGISHALGLGGRDLSEEIGGISAEIALDMLNQDTKTKVIAFVSKPPAPSVKEKIIQKMQSLTKPVIAIFLGHKPTQQNLGNGVELAYTLDEAAKKAVMLAKIQRIITSQKTSLYQGKIYGLYTGGTLATECAILMAEALNLQVDNSHHQGIMLNAKGHMIIDLGDDFYTLGRPHPMIDPSTRTDQIEKLKDTEFSILLVDIVLGFGGHIDPAGAITQAIIRLRQQRQQDFIVIATITGTVQDPQSRQKQIQILKEAEIIIANNIREAVELAVGLIHTKPQDQISKTNTLLKQPKIINIGLNNFAQDLLNCQAEAIHFRWAPIAGGNQKMIELLAKLS
ncbi:acyl-CoA synthetase FdrA [Mergibacter septicus]|uniref:acyl-CoA synthetase FdrA n=1 Tax=Mergibacter septicus TaxID=221402 RepID=UPI001C78F5F4|nr:acyl-CoA synthetase FdrA [Mergibacter septicus]QDJ12923.1 acyl-CoA synthetase FdrA [Mergibacter septicus]